MNDRSRLNYQISDDDDDGDDYDAPFDCVLKRCLLLSLFDSSLLLLHFRNINMQVADW